MTRNSPPSFSPPPAGKVSADAGSLTNVVGRPPPDRRDSIVSAAAPDDVLSLRSGVPRRRDTPPPRLPTRTLTAAASAAASRARAPTTRGLARFPNAAACGASPPPVASPLPARASNAPLTSPRAHSTCPSHQARHGPRAGTRWRAPPPCVFRSRSPRRTGAPFIPRAVGGSSGSSTSSCRTSGWRTRWSALTALRLLKADDTLLQKLLKAGVLPVPPPRSSPPTRPPPRPPSTTTTDPPRRLLARRRRRRRRRRPMPRGVLLLPRFPLPPHSGGAVEVLSACLCSHDGEVARDGFGRGSIPADGGDDDVRDGDSMAVVGARARPSRASSRWRACPGSRIAGGVDESAFDATRTPPDAPPTLGRAAASSASASRSFLCLLESDVWSCRTGTPPRVSRGWSGQR